MASAAAAPGFERVAGIRAIAESGRFKASSSLPTSQACFLDLRYLSLCWYSRVTVVAAMLGVRLATIRETWIPMTRSQILLRNRLIVVEIRTCGVGTSL